jgi:hypothetical protein
MDLQAMPSAWPISSGPIFWSMILTEISDQNVNSVRPALAWGEGSIIGVTGANTIEMILHCHGYPFPAFYIRVIHTP